MSREVLLSCAIVGVIGLSSASAHHAIPGRSHPVATVRIPETALADGKPLPAGIYEVRVSDEHPATPSGTPSENQRWVEFVAGGSVVAREVAEVFPDSGREVVGTSGSSESAAATVQLLRGGEFFKVALTDGDGRYLIHLPRAGSAVRP